MSEDAALRLDEQLCFKLYAASRAVIRGYRPMLESLGLTYPQYLAMLVLWEWRDAPPAHPTVKALGERLALDSGTLTPLLKRLEHLGLVQRQRGRPDEREVHLALTEAGAALRDRVGPLRDALMCRAGLERGGLGALREQLDGLLAQLTGSG
ncbi:MarR family winged helix-turn-helix transcriptional regulator [Pseudomonas mangiferae]|uniref:MarR family transcriptional regulator n=1 Tax=Pseudomonas mangiferae TaxID=2593654 RepID=A0A553GUI4_9PSED|nr:MarR family transcriptional regulator [Pseudomonas mangiferae]TRX73141.1 MarR family transcriptional regulator [Pseudomonas mangiferae]